jgi:acetyl esterase/lipase
VLIERDLVYAEVEGVPLALDLYRSAASDAPLVVYVHGGGWRSGRRGDDAARLEGLAAFGVTVASVDYRLVPAAVFPAPLHDVKGAVRWLRARGPDMGLPTDHIGIWGASAGAYLASLLALTNGDAEFEGTVGGNLDHSSAVQAVVHWFGQADLVAAASRTPVEARLLPFHFEAGLLGVDRVADVAEQARRIGLLGRVSAAAPPFLIAHGDRDHVVAPAESHALHDALARSGANSRLLVLGGAGHEGPEFDEPATLAMTAAWLRTTLLGAD